MDKNNIFFLNSFHQCYNSKVKSTRREVSNILNIQIDEPIKELLNELNQMGNTVIFGGYLRDLLLDISPNDVDIMTNIPMDVLEKQYCHMKCFNRRTNLTGHEILSFSLGCLPIDIVYSEDNVFNQGSKSDYSLNSLVFDGEKLIDTQGALKDIDEKKINLVNIHNIKKDFPVKPFSWLKPFRLVSYSGFDLSNEIYLMLQEHRDVFTRIKPENKQWEGMKVLKGKHISKMMESLALMDLFHSADMDDLIQFYHLN